MSLLVDLSIFDDFSQTKQLQCLDDSVGLLIVRHQLEPSDLAVVRSCWGKLRR
jgi:hypothetical protein